MWIYDAATLKLHRLLPGVGFQGGVSNLFWHPDSKRLAVAADNGLSFRILTLDGTVLFETDSKNRFVTSIAWNHAGHRSPSGSVLPSTGNPRQRSKSAVPRESWSVALRARPTLHSGSLRSVSSLWCCCN